MNTASKHYLYDPWGCASPRHRWNPYQTPRPPLMGALTRQRAWFPPGPGGGRRHSGCRAWRHPWLQRSRSTKRSRPPRAEPDEHQIRGAQKMHTLSAGKDAEWNCNNHRDIINMVTFCSCLCNSRIPNTLFECQVSIIASIFATTSTWKSGQKTLIVQSCGPVGSVTLD